MMRARRMTASHVGTCTQCHTPIVPGEPIYWARGIGAWHADCTASAREQASKARELALASRYVEACGPLPERVWEDSTAVASFGRMVDGGHSTHVLELNGGLYLQVASFPGWRFTCAYEASP